MRVSASRVSSAVVFSATAALAAGAQTPGHRHHEDPPAKFSQAGPSGQLAPRLQNLGKHVFPVTTKTARAQLFINQGVNLAYGFNHAEADRSFKEAARLDPDCAMAWWGRALVFGPNINAPMAPEAEPVALGLINKAMALRAKASLKERGYIEALAKRYTGDAKDRTAADKAYAVAMRKLHKTFPADLDMATLFAEALMDLRPWNYWRRDGSAHEETPEVLRVLEAAMKKDPHHAGANHLYIHLVESTWSPERAEGAADRLLPAMPGAGHMVHMPSHIYMRIGRYTDASKSNQMAIAADEDYITQCRAQGMYPLAYYPHNIHFLWAAATMEGRSQEAIEAALKTASKVPLEQLSTIPLMQIFLAAPWFALTRFGKWEEILKEPKMQEGYPFLTGVRNYARGAAFAATGKFAEAESELADLAKSWQDVKGNPTVSFSVNSGEAILAVGRAVLAGEIAARRGDTDRAIALLHEAVLLEDGLIYTEPADWHYPVRQSLGAVLLAAGRAAEAETIYWDDLSRNRENGWSLFGLMQALKAQEKTDQAAAVEKRFQKAWATADVKLTASRF